MKELKGFGVVLKPMSQGDLGRVRKWRNADHVRENFEYQKEITEADQEKWYAEMDAEKNWYWVIWVGEKPIGVVHAKEIDWEKRNAEAGIFIGETSYLRTPFPAAAILVMMDYVFGEMKFRALFAKIKRGAEQNENLNIRLGYRLLPDQASSDFLRYQCLPQDYFSGFRSRFPSP